MKKVLLIALSVVLFTWKVSFSGSVEAFNSRLFDLMYFTRPFERAAIGGGAWEGSRGSSISVMQNPAALGSAKSYELTSFLTITQLKGETYGLKKVTTSGEGDLAVTNKIYEKPHSQIYNAGISQIFHFPNIAGTFGFVLDYIGSNFTDNNKTKIEDYGYRFGIAYGLPLSDNFSIGYGVTLLQDNWQWGVTWAEFSTESSTPDLINYYLKSKALSLRHRVGIQGSVGHPFRYGVEIDFGHGNTDNKWNDVSTGGGNGMLHYGIRGGFAYDVFENTTVNFDVQLYRTLVEFGYHSAGITENNIARWDAAVFRTMTGIHYQATKWLQLIAGYRYNQFNVQDLCTKHADNTYDTFAGGLKLTVAEQFNLLWNIEYSNVAPQGEVTNAFAVRFCF